MNRLVKTISVAVFVSLAVACAQDAVFIQRRLPLPGTLNLPKIGLPICGKDQIECVKKETAKDIIVRDAMLKGQIKEMKMTIKSTWGSK